MGASRLRMLGIAILGLIIIGVILTVVFLLPAYLIPSSSSPAQTEALKAQNEVRATLLQGIAGIVLLVGAYFTWRQIQVSKEAQLTERFTRTVEQLGNSKCDIRIGGIYGLERVAKDSPTDREPIAEILATYIQSHAPWPAQDSLSHTTPSTSPEVPLNKLPSLRTRAPDIHAAITVLGRRQGINVGGRRLKLYAVDLRKGNLQGANLRRADLRWSTLHGAYLLEANLGAARLEYADLRRATLRGANLQDASLDGAKLQGVTANRSTVWPIGFDPVAAGVFVEDHLN
jgi:hypothetical protein